LQIIAIHPNLESATRPTRKGWVITNSCNYPADAENIRGIGHSHAGARQAGFDFVGGERGTFGHDWLRFKRAQCAL
jgi:hypothetical protein